MNVLSLVLSQLTLPTTFNGVPPPPSIGQLLLNFVTSPSGLTTLITTVVGAVALFIGTGELRRRRVALGASVAFHIVESINAALADNSPTLDKAAEGLRQLDGYFLAQGWRKPTPSEQAVATLQFQALNGLQKTAVKSVTGALANLTMESVPGGAAMLPTVAPAIAPVSIGPKP